MQKHVTREYKIAFSLLFVKKSLRKYCGI